MTSTGLESGENPMFPSRLNLVLRGLGTIEAGLGLQVEVSLLLVAPRNDEYHGPM